MQNKSDERLVDKNRKVIMAYTLSAVELVLVEEALEELEYLGSLTPAKSALLEKLRALYK